MKIIGQLLLGICFLVCVVLIIGLIVTAFFEDVVAGTVIVSFIIALSLGIVFTALGDK
jgi:hypothetical protein